jgi:hypothetical protein
LPLDVGEHREDGGAHEIEPEVGVRALVERPELGGCERRQYQDCPGDLDELSTGEERRYGASSYG